MAGKTQIDPLKERKAQEVGLALGVDTLEQVAAQDGDDWEELLEQQALEKQVREELDLPAPSYLAEEIDPDQIGESGEGETTQPN